MERWKQEAEQDSCDASPRSICAFYSRYHIYCQKNIIKAKKVYIQF